MKQLLRLGMILCVAIALSGCSIQQSVDSRDSDLGTINTGGAESQKKGDTTVSGSVSKVGEKFYITDNAGKKQELESYTFDLGTIVGKTVTVTGQFSGDTLFVGKVSE